MDSSQSSAGAYKKYIALFIFCLFSMINGFAWIMFEPSKKNLRAAFGSRFTESQQTLLSSWQPFVFAFVAPFVTARIVKPDGLRVVLKFACFMELIGSSVKFLAFVSPDHPWALALLHIGQILSAAASPVSTGSPSILSATWFPEHQRTRATAAAVLSKNLGSAMAYLAVPGLSDAYGFVGVLAYEFGYAVILVCLVWLFVPPQPVKVKALKKASEPRAEAIDVIAETKALFMIPSAVILYFIHAWIGGGYVAWNSMFDGLLEERWNDEFIGALTFSSTIAYVVGGIITSALVDSNFRHRMRMIVITALAGALAACWLLTLSVPSVFLSGDAILIDWGNAWLFAVFILCGYCNGSAAPLFYELIAEITYPISEGVSGNVLGYFKNFGALLLYQGISHVANGRVMNLIFTSGLAMCLVSLRFVKQELHRHTYELEQRAGLADIDTFDTGDSDWGSGDHSSGGARGGFASPYERMEELM